MIKDLLQVHFIILFIAQYKLRKNTVIHGIGYILFGIHVMWTIG